MDCFGVLRTDTGVLLTPVTGVRMGAATCPGVVKPPGLMTPVLAAGPCCDGVWTSLDRNGWPEPTGFVGVKAAT
jgi:hypothetical protein